MKLISPLIMTLCCLGSSVLAAQTSLSSADQLSYAMGYKTGQAMKAREIAINANLFNSGLKDGYENHKPMISEKDMQTALAVMQQEMIKKMQAKFQEIADKNAADGKAFLNTNAKKPGVVTTLSGLQYQIIKPGSGDSPSAQDTVTVNYEGSLINGTVFDSSFQRKSPVSFKVNEVIKGWQEALVMMKPGAEWMLYIPSNLAYGDRGSLGAIGPNETLIFKVDLLSVKK